MIEEQKNIHIQKKRGREGRMRGKGKEGNRTRGMEIWKLKWRLEQRTEEKGKRGSRYGKQRG